MNRLTISLIAAVITCGLTACASKIAPKVNPHPKYFLTISGHIDPLIARDLKITWQGQYFSHNPKCQYVKNWAVGPINRMVYVTFAPIVPKINGDYKIKIPIDYFEGFCKWQVSGIWYGFKYKQYTSPKYGPTAIGFTQKGIVRKRSMTQTYLCDTNQCLLTKESTIYNPYNLSPYHSTSARIDFKTL